MDVTEDELKRFFNSTMALAAQGPPGEIVLSVYLNLEKKFGFVEFRSVDEATAALSLDGIDFRGLTLKMRRPNDYIPPVGGTPGGSTINLASQLGVVSSQVPDGPNKVFCGGLPNALNEEDVKELISVHGPLKAFHLVKENGSMTNKGFCFWEYIDPTVTVDAVEALNGIRIGPRTLTVRRSLPKDGFSGGAGGFDPSNPLSALGLPALPAVLNSLNSAAPTEPKPTCVLVMTNMIGSTEELVDNANFTDLSEDVELELRKYGEVRRLLIPRPDPTGKSVRGLLKVFCQFATPAQAAAAFEEVNGREFGDEVVAASYMDESDFAAGNL